MSLPVRADAAWSIILTSNEHGRPCEYFMSRYQLDCVDIWKVANNQVGRSAAHVLGECIKTADPTLNQLNKLKGAVINAQERLASYMGDNTEDGVWFEDAHPDLDSIREMLLGYVQ